VRDNLAIYQQLITSLSIKLSTRELMIERSDANIRFEIHIWIEKLVC